MREGFSKNSHLEPAGGEGEPCKCIGENIPEKSNKCKVPLVRL